MLLGPAMPGALPGPAPGTPAGLAKGAAAATPSLPRTPAATTGAIRATLTPTVLAPRLPQPPQNPTNIQNFQLPPGEWQRAAGGEGGCTRRPWRSRKFWAAFWGCVLAGWHAKPRGGLCPGDLTVLRASQSWSSRALRELWCPVGVLWATTVWSRGPSFSFLR